MTNEQLLKLLALAIEANESAKRMNETQGKILLALEKEYANKKL